MEIDKEVRKKLKNDKPGKLLIDLLGLININAVDNDMRIKRSDKFDIDGFHQTTKHWPHRMVLNQFT
jgi:hypothetical protein